VKVLDGLVRSHQPVLLWVHLAPHLSQTGQLHFVDTEHLLSFHLFPFKDSC
jgi:hypothetical protein